MHIMRPVLELSNEWGQSDSGGGWKERAGEELEVGKEPLWRCCIHIFSREIETCLQLKSDALQT